MTYISNYRLPNNNQNGQTKEQNVANQLSKFQLTNS